MAKEKVTLDKEPILNKEQNPNKEPILDREPVKEVKKKKTVDEKIVMGVSNAETLQKQGYQLISAVRENKKDPFSPKKFTLRKET